MVRMGGRCQQKVVPKKDVIRVKAKKYESSKSATETKTFSVDPELTRYSTLRELLIKAFNIQEDFVISYLVSGHEHSGDHRYLPMLSEWDLDTAVYAASEPHLVLKVDLKSTEMRGGLEEWDIIDDDDISRLANSNLVNSCIPVVREVSSERSEKKSERKRRSWFFDRPDPADNAQRPPQVECQSRVRKPSSPKHPMTESEFKSYLDAEGRLLHSASFREAVFAAGLDSKVRQSIWPHLLHVYPEGMTADERSAYAQRLCQKYECLKESWQRRLRRGFIDEELRLVANSVRKDVIRTDRSHPFFSGDEDRNKNLMALFNILTTYALAHPEVSYCQGMSDLASPLLVVLKDESMTYLCFCALMRRTHDNFACDGWTMTRKFHHLGELVQYYDPIFFEYLREMHSEDLLFAYRWLLLELKREFAFDDAMVLMEVIWASLPGAGRSADGGCESDLYDVDLTAVCDDGAASVARHTMDEWTSSMGQRHQNGEEGVDDDGADEDGNASGQKVECGTRFGLPSSRPAMHSCPGILGCSGGVCPALVVRSLMLNHKENKRLHAIRHASYPPKFTYDDATLANRSYPRSRSQNQRFTIGCWSEDLKADIFVDTSKFLEPIFDEVVSSDSENLSCDEERKEDNDNLKRKDRSNSSRSQKPGRDAKSTGAEQKPEETIRDRPLPRTYSLRPSPEMKVSDSQESDESSTDHLFDRQAVPVAAEAYFDFQRNASKSDQTQNELTLTRIHEICLANIPTDDSVVASSKASSACVSRRSREPSGEITSKPEMSNTGTGTAPFTTTDVSNFSTRASTVSNGADSGIYEPKGNQSERSDVIDIGDYVNVDRDPTVCLPSPGELGDGNPFMLFVCLTMILQNRDQIMKSNLDFNEISVYFDRLMRKHDVQKILKRARVLFLDYVKTNSRVEQEIPCMGISKAVAVSGGKYTER